MSAAVEGGEDSGGEVLVLGWVSGDVVVVGVGVGGGLTPMMRMFLMLRSWSVVILRSYDWESVEGREREER